MEIGTRVRIVKVREHEGATGVVVGGTVWYRTEKDPGDRTVRMDGTGERLHFQRYMMEEA